MFAIPLAGILAFWAAGAVTVVALNDPDKHVVIDTNDQKMMIVEPESNQKNKQRSLFY